MFERFSDKARHVVVLAQEEARLLEHNVIGTEHLLLGMLHEGTDVAFQVLDGFGLDLQGTRDEVLQIIGPGPGAKEGHIPFTPRSKKVLELGLREAMALGHNYIGTEHLLLGLVREGTGVGAQIVAAHAPEPAAISVRMAVLDRVPAGGAERSGGFLRRLAVRSIPLQPMVPDTTPAAEQTLEQATRLAGAQPVGSQHLLLAALGDPESAAARALSDLGVDLDRAKEALGAVDVTGTTDEPPEDAGRRQMRVLVSDDVVIVEARDATLLPLARAALDAVGGDPQPPGAIDGDVPAAVRLGAVWLALRDAFVDIRRRAVNPGVEDEADSA
jgi:ATP-dependent Clp protease ATP-binding subunit ClpC